MRRALLTASGKAPIILPAIGDSFMGGYYAGIIDTTKGNIIAADAFQTGARYALICAPKSLQAFKAYKTTNDASPSTSNTRWNGLGATIGMNSSTYPAAQYCYGLTAPSDDASPWYFPAMDEMQLMYRNLKTSGSANSTATTTGSTFPGGTLYPGYNPSSDPAGAAWTSSNPAQTTVLAFTTGNAQAFTTDYYRMSTDYGTTADWYMLFDTGTIGLYGSKPATNMVRPVRRLLL